MGAGESRISTARAVPSPQISPKASCIITPVPLHPLSSYAPHKSRLLKIAPNDGIQRVNIGAAYKRWRLHRSVYQSKLSSPLRSGRDTPYQVRTFQENLKSKLKDLASTENPDAKPQAQRLTYRLHNRKQVPLLIRSSSSYRVGTPGTAAIVSNQSPTSAARVAPDLSTALTAQLRNAASKQETVPERLKEKTEPVLNINSSSDLASIVARMRSTTLKKASSAESLRETPDSALSKLNPDQSALARRPKGLGSLSKLRRSSAIEIPSPTGLVREEDSPPVETRGLMVVEAEQGRVRRGSAV